MNFDTKYLIRWGIPGWTMMMALGPYYFVSYYDAFKDLTISTPTNLIAISAVLAVMGVPLGYLLNQIQHSLTWVLVKFIKREWFDYFDEEIQIDEHFYKSESGNERRERFRYLLSRKHELGGIYTSLLISGFLIAWNMNMTDNQYLWSKTYLIVVLVVGVLIMISYLYSSANIDAYTKHYLNKKT